MAVGARAALEGACLKALELCVAVMQADASVEDAHGQKARHGTLIPIANKTSGRMGDY